MRPKPQASRTTKPLRIRFVAQTLFTHGMEVRTVLEFIICEVVCACGLYGRQHLDAPLFLDLHGTAELSVKQLLLHTCTAEHKLLARTAQAACKVKATSAWIIAESLPRIAPPTPQIPMPVKIGMVGRDRIPLLHESYQRAGQRAVVAQCSLLCCQPMH